MSRREASGLVSANKFRAEGRAPIGRKRAPDGVAACRRGCSVVVRPNTLVVNLFHRSALVRHDARQPLTLEMGNPQAHPSVEVVLATMLSTSSAR